jgi:hypothetical protein
VLVANTSALPARLLVSLHFEDGTGTSRLFEDVTPGSRLNVPVSEVFPEADGRRFGVTVESYGTGAGDSPAAIVVERAMYWDANGQRWAAGTNAMATRVQ